MPATSMEELVSLCKRRGFIFQGSEIYGGLQGFYDYGPLGVELKNNIKAAWWRSNVYERDDMEGLDASIIMHRLVLRHSGHEATFSDPMVDNKKNNKRYRLDHLVKDQKTDVIAKVAAEIGEDAGNFPAVVAGLIKNPERASQALKAAGVRDPFSGEVGDWTEPKPFNMMFKTTIGPVADDESYGYLRPETAQGIFTNFKNVVDSTSRRLPFGIAQIGKAFRNEITPRNSSSGCANSNRWRSNSSVPPARRGLARPLAREALELVGSPGRAAQQDRDSGRAQRRPGALLQAHLRPDVRLPDAGL